MSHGILKAIQRLQNDSTHYIVYYEGQRRVLRTYAELHADVMAAAARLAHPAQDRRIETLAIVGPTSYQWMVIDLACIGLGILTIAIPENVTRDEFRNILDVEKPELVLIDHSLRPRFHGFERSKYFRCPPAAEVDDFLAGSPASRFEFPSSRRHEIYTVAFSSGTHGRLKPLRIRFVKYSTFGAPTGSFRTRMASTMRILRLRGARRLRRGKRMLLWMPFSHLQQRILVQVAIQDRMNLILSNAADCMKHLILERPSFMVSVPVLYEVVADRIRTKTSTFGPIRGSLFRLYNRSGLNARSELNPIKRLVDWTVLRDVRRLAGGRAEYFISGSAGIRRYALDAFFSIGIRIREAYGLSETGLISLNGDRQFRLGSVGKPNREVKIADDSEILLQHEPATHAGGEIIVDDAGFIHTGDTGYLDQDGFLYVTGRKDDLIVLPTGKKVTPQKIEERLLSTGIVHQAFVFLREEGELGSVLVIDEVDRGTSETPGRVKDLVAAVNESLSAEERVASYHVSDEPFSIANGLLTVTLKLKRGAARERYRDRSFSRVSR